MDFSLPRPTRPRSWCSWDNPYRSAFSMSIITALGTSTPTSTTVVATSTCRVPSEKAAMTCSFSEDFMRPWSMPTPVALQRPAAYLVPVCFHRCHVTVVVFHQRANQIRLPPGVQVLADERKRPGTLVAADEERIDLLASGGELIQDRQIQVAVNHQRQRAGMGVALITSRWGWSPFCARAARWATPKRCCSSVTTSPSRWNLT